MHNLHISLKSTDPATWTDILSAAIRYRHSLLHSERATETVNYKAQSWMNQRRSRWVISDEGWVEKTRF